MEREVKRVTGEECAEKVAVEGRVSETHNEGVEGTRAINVVLAQAGWLRGLVPNVLSLGLLEGQGVRKEESGSYPFLKLELVHAFHELLLLLDHPVERLDVIDRFDQ